MTEFNSARADSPCIKICSLTVDGLCYGCGRSSDEITRWTDMAQEEREAIWDRVISQGYPAQS